MSEHDFFTSTIRKSYPNPNNYWSETSISPIEQSYNPKEIERVVESLVMSRYGSEYSEKFKKSFSRKSQRISSVSNDDEDSSSVYSFDDYNFLKSALGDEYKSLRDLPSSSGISSGTINTYNLSELISHENVYQSIKNGNLQHIKDYSSSSSTIQDDSFLVDQSLIIDLKSSKEEALQQEILATDTTIRQISKAIFFDDARQNDFGPARIEAEKLLLISEMKRNLLIQEFQSLYAEEQCLLHVGSITISGLHLWPQNQTTNEHFLCLILYKTEVYCTEIATIKSNGAVHLKGKFAFPKLNSNFKISLRIYSLIKPSQMGKSKKEQINENVPSVRSSLFKLRGETEITISHIQSQLNHIKLSMNRYKLTAHISGGAHINPNLTGFVNVATMAKGCPIWDKLWCILNGTTLFLWNNPSEQMYNDSKVRLNLLCCEQVRIPTRFECVRSKTILLKMRDGRDYLISFDTLSEFHRWKNTLNSVLSMIKMWKNVF